MRIAFILIILIIIGCSNDDKILAEQYEHCLPPVRMALGLGNCSSILTSTGTDACDTERLTEYQLSDKTKSYMSLFCKLDGDTLTYKSNQDEVAHFVISEQNYQTFRTWADTDEKCHPDSSTTIHLCYDSELAEVRMKSSELELDLKVISKVKLDRKDPRSGRIADILEVQRWTSNNSYFMSLYVVTDKRTLNYDYYDRDEFYSTITLNETEYYDVISMDVSNIYNFHYKYYLDQENGIIGLLDEEGKLWTLID